MSCPSHTGIARLSSFASHYDQIEIIPSRVVLAAGSFTTTLFLGRVPAHSAPDLNEPDKENILRGFIVSDAHFGWHNYAKDSDYGDWTNTVVRGCGPLPFFFTMGNHEADAFGYDWDPEWKTACMGSIGCRPYYSFDVKGIHFLVLHNLARVNYVTREELEWGALDLDINKDKTTIVLSHNSLKGTTEPMFDNAYRVIANSDEVYDLLDRHGRVVAWMHGHNHDYKIVPKSDRIYVSNGRLGGFPPPIEGSSVPADIAAKPHIGGMYFEVHPDNRDSGDEWPPEKGRNAGLGRLLLGGARRRGG